MTYVRAELKADAKSQLSGNWGRAIGAMLLVTLFGALWLEPLREDFWAILTKSSI